MRRLVALVSAVVLVDTLLYAVLTPLLPRFVDQLDLSKTLAGVLVAAYPLGALVGGIPGGVAAVRLGPRRAVLAGLGLFSVASIAFAVADAYPALLVARFVQGAGSALTWAGAFSWLVGAAPRNRRGELIGTAFAAAIVGALLGPALGSLAASVGRGEVFVGLAALGGALAVTALLVPPVPGERTSLAALGPAFRQPRFLGGLASMALPALLFGLLAVLAPLHLHAAGWTATAIGVLWVVGAAGEAAEAPLVGRLGDRRGWLLPIRAALAISAVASVGLAFGGRPVLYVPFVFVAILAYSVLFTPALALIADGADDAGLAQGLAFGLMNAAWAIGAVVGPLVGGALASATSDAFPFALAAGLCTCALALLRARPVSRAAASSEA